MDRDARLLELLEQDPEAGLAALMERYGGAVRAAVARRLSNEEDVRECVNDVFAQFYFQRARFDAAKGSLKTWLCTIARRRALDLYRKNQSWERSRQAAARQGESEPGPAGPLEEWLLEELAEKERAIVWLRLCAADELCRDRRRLAPALRADPQVRLPGAEKAAQPAGVPCKRIIDKKGGRGESACRLWMFYGLIPRRSCSSRPAGRR